jgi:5-methylcytosine-specific restriction enzyme A
MEFREFHKVFFNSSVGSFSRVTDREFYDSQITLTDIEAQLVIDYFGFENIQVGNVGSNRAKASKIFLHYPSLEPIELNLVFPKPNKTELRLYLSSQKGFKPQGGEIWFLYKDKYGQLVIGALPEVVWNNLGQDDTTDDSYQADIEQTLSTSKNFNVAKEGRIIINVTNGRKVYGRDPRLAVLRFEESSYSCEIDPTHKTFIAQSTKNPYVEAHHFIPMKFQELFEKPLDNFDNIISLCPNCHRGIHHAVIDYKFNLVKQLYNKRPVLHSYSLDSIAQFYNTIRVPDKL